MMKHSSILASIACALLCVTLSSCSKDKLSLLYLAEADGAEQGASFTIMYNGKPYERTPIFSINQFSSFSSFLDPDGSYGVVLIANTKYQSRLFSATAARPGKLLLPVMNGLAFEPSRIDRPISDGKLVIWNGLNGYDLRLMANTLEPVDKEIEEKRFLEKDPRPRPKFKPVEQQERDASGRVIPEIPTIN